MECSAVIGPKLPRLERYRTLTHHKVVERQRGRVLSSCPQLVVYLLTKDLPSCCGRNKKDLSRESLSIADSFRADYQPYSQSQAWRFHFEKKFTISQILWASAQAATAPAPF